MKKYQIIEIKWLDSLSTSGWKKESLVKTSKERMIHKTIGYFITEDPQSILVIQSFNLSSGPYKDDIYVDGIMEIPKKAIIRIRKLN